jgi:hypothetical protein
LYDVPPRGAHAGAIVRFKTHLNDLYALEIRLPDLEPVRNEDEMVLSLARFSLCKYVDGSLCGPHGLLEGAPVVYECNVEYLYGVPSLFVSGTSVMLLQRSHENGYMMMMMLKEGKWHEFG